MTKLILLISSLTLLISFIIMFIGYGYRNVSLICLGMLLLHITTSYFLVSPSKHIYKLFVFLIYPEMILLSSLGLEWGHHIPPGDSIFWIQVTELIKKESHWQIGIGTFRGVSYSEYPVLSILGAVISIITSLDVITLSKLFPTIITPITLLFYVLFIRKTTGSLELAMLSGVILAINPYLTAFNIINPYHYEKLAIAYIAIVLYLLSSYFSSKYHRTYVYLALLIIILMPMTHHWASYNSILLIISFYLLPPIYSRFLSIFYLFNKKTHSTGPRNTWNKLFPIIIYATGAILAYQIYIAYKTSSTLFKLLVEESPKAVTLKISYNPWNYMLFELIMIVIGHLQLAILGFLGLIKSFKLNKTINRIFECSFLVGGMYFLYLFVFYSKFSLTYTIRTYPYFFMLVAPIITYGILSTNKVVKLAKTASLIMILLASFSLPGLFHELEQGYPIRSQTDAIYQSINTLSVEEGAKILYPPPHLFQIIAALRKLDVISPKQVTPADIYKAIDFYNITKLMKDYNAKYLFFYKGLNPSEIDKFFIRPYYNSTFSTIYCKLCNNSLLTLAYDNGIFVLFVPRY